MNGASLDLIHAAVRVCLTVSAPMLLTALLVGIGVSVLQAVTQIQEQTLTFIPKLLLITLVFMMTLPWVMRELIEYLVTVLRALPNLTA